jgi:hypothetical protein
MEPLKIDTDSETLRLYLEKAMCLGKDKHKSKLAAEYIVDNFKGRNDPTVEIYRCSFCDGWHVGHNPKHYLAKYNKRRTR